MQGTNCQGFHTATKSALGAQPDWGLRARGARRCASFCSGCSRQGGADFPPPLMDTAPAWSDGCITAEFAREEFDENQIGLAMIGAKEGKIT